MRNTPLNCFLSCWHAICLSNTYRREAIRTREADHEIMGVTIVSTDQWQMISGKRILVVEDDDLFRRSLCGLVHSLGYDVIQADGIDAALKLCESTRIDLVLTDYQLVGNTGVDLISAMRKSGIEVPFVVISGYPADIIRERSHGVIFAAYLRKPAELYKLQDLLPDLLGDMA